MAQMPVTGPKPTLSEWAIAARHNPWLGEVTRIDVAQAAHMTSPSTRGESSRSTQRTSTSAYARYVESRPVTEPSIIPDNLWRGKPEGSRYKIRIVDIRRDGRVVIERTAGAPVHALRRELTVTEDQLRTAYTPTDEWDYGS